MSEASDSIVTQPQDRTSLFEKKLSRTPFIDSPTFEILAWKSKWRSLKYFLAACLIFFLNVVHGVSLTVIFLTIFYIKGSMQVLKCKLKGPTFTEEKRKKDKEEEILSEESI